MAPIKTAFKAYLRMHSSFLIKPNNGFSTLANEVMIKKNRCLLYHNYGHCVDFNFGSAINS